MISYDDLVAALQAWRARQGLPVEQPTTGITSGSGPRSVAPPPPAPRTNPPAPPMAARTPMPLAAPEETHEDLDEHEHEHEHEIEEHALVEESQYENEGDDFAMSFAQDGHNGHVTGVNGEDGGETMLGHDPNVEPDRPSELTDPAAAQRNGRDDW